MYFFVIMSMPTPSIDIVAMVITRHGHTANDIPLKHSSRLYHPSLAVAQLLPGLQDPAPHQVRPELRQEVLLGDPHLPLPPLPPLHPPPRPHGSHRLREDLHRVVHDQFRSV